MAKAASQKVALPWKPLARSLTPRERRALAGYLGKLLDWQCDLRAWPREPREPRATPFVSFYERGRLSGCVGSNESIARAFLSALHDPRQSPSVDHAALSAELTYLTEARPIVDLSSVEVGTHGLAWVATDRAALLLPQVARDHGWTADVLLDALCDKAKVKRAELASGVLYRLAGESIVVHAEPFSVREQPASSLGSSANALAARWLAGLIERDGSICFAIDPRSRERVARGLMYHGRAAIVLEALRAWPRHRHKHALATRWLTNEINAGLRGRKPVAWPDDEAVVCGTLALAVRAGLPFRDALIERAAAALTTPWHAAQVVAALGTDAPAELWASCVRALKAQPFAPWTALAALARGDTAVYARTSAALIDALRPGVVVRTVPEVALTAITVEALAAGPPSKATNESRAAIARGRSFLERWQFLPERISAGLDPACTLGAFPLSPVASSLRCDVTAHALLALYP